MSEGEAAGAHFERALAAAPGELWPFERARVLLAYGEYLRRERATVESRVQLVAALALFDRLRAAPWAEQTRNEMSATGLSCRPADVSQVQLTPQELQIATLAASGLTNRVIGGFLDGDREFTERAGDLVLCPRGNTHRFTNTGLHPAKLLFMYTPGGAEGLFVEGGDEPRPWVQVQPWGPERIDERMLGLLAKCDAGLPVAP